MAKEKVPRPEQMVFEGRWHVKPGNRIEVTYWNGKKGDLDTCRGTYYMVVGHYLEMKPNNGVRMLKTNLIQKVKRI